MHLAARTVAGRLIMAAPARIPTTAASILTPIGVRVLGSSMDRVSMATDIMVVADITEAGIASLEPPVSGGAIL